MSCQNSPPEREDEEHDEEKNNKDKEFNKAITISEMCNGKGYRSYQKSRLLTRSSPHQNHNMLDEKYIRCLFLCAFMDVDSEDKKVGITCITGSYSMTGWNRTWIPQSAECN